MKGIIKVNFNNARIKLPTLNPVLVAWKSIDTIIFSHDNLSKFDECKMIVYREGEKLFETNMPYFYYTVTEVLEGMPLSLEIELEAKVHQYKTNNKLTYTLIQDIICSEHIVCSEELFCQD